MSIATLLSERLSSTLDACAQFAEHDAVNFHDFENISYGKETLRSIQSAMQGLGGLETDLKIIMNRCEKFCRKVCGIL